MSPKLEKVKGKNPPLLNPVVLDSVFKNLSPCDLCRCRLVHQSWNTVAQQAIKKSLKTRLLLCADQKCARNLEKFLKCFKISQVIPYTRAILILDHLPTTSMDTEDLILKNLDRFSLVMAAVDEAFETPNSLNSWNYSKTLYTTTLKFSNSIENLIVTLTLHQDDSTNMENWLSKLEFPNLKELHFHVTKTSPEDMSLESFQRFFNSAHNLETLGIRKLCKNSDNILCKILQALETKQNLSRIKKLYLEVFTDDKKHLEILSHLPLSLEYLSILYLGGEVRYIDKLEDIKNLIDRASPTLKCLCTHIPLFSGGQMNFPKLPWVHTLKIEKVYREFAPDHSQIFDFEFSKYFPRLRKIKFWDYDLWKNAQLNAFPMENIQVCRTVEEISLPDLCFNGLLMEKYLRTFTNIRKLSCIVSYLSKHQSLCTFTQIYSLLPKLKELEVQIYDVDIPVYDNIFIGFSVNTIKNVPEINLTDFEQLTALALEQKQSITLMEDLEMLKVTYFNDAKVLGISDFTVLFGFLNLKALKKLTIGYSLISNEGLKLMTQKFDVILMQPSSRNSNDVVLKEKSEFPNRNTSGKYDCGHMCL